MNLNHYKKVRTICGINTRVITCKYLGPTNIQGSRIKLYDRHFAQSVTIPYNYEFSNAVEGAVSYLLSLGFVVVGMNSTAIKKEYIIIINSWDCEQRITNEVTK